eukprot:Hpha_TRINITY_DN3488_c0_g1::TRINITY_DN3488_c0_g1_i1::g.32664::m.32664
MPLPANVGCPTSPPRSVLPRCTPDGLEGNDPTTGLAYVNLRSVHASVAPSVRPMFVNPQGYAVVFFFAPVAKASPGKVRGAVLPPQKRILVVGSAAVYLVRPSLEVSRCLPIKEVQMLYLSDDLWCGLKVPREYDMLFKVSTQQEADELARVLGELVKAHHGGELPVMRFSARSQNIRGLLRLSKPAGWTTERGNAVLESHPLKVIAPHHCATDDGPVSGRTPTASPSPSPRDIPTTVLRPAPPTS